MSLLRRRMMMAKEPDVPDTPTEELDYLTIIPLHEEEMWYYIYPYGGTNDMNPLSPVYTQAIPFYYRINRGEWVEVNLPDSDSLAWSVKLNKDTELQLKSMGCNFDEIYATDIQYFKISGGGDYNVSGTPMSLLYGDGFKENDYACSYVLWGLFRSEVGLTKILNPKTFLPYTKLGYWCYDNMFFGCINLTNAPELPAEILVDGCYNDMFYRCHKINYIKMLATDISADSCLNSWVSDVSPTGTFVKHPDMTSLPTGDSGIPEGWTIVNDGEESGGNDFGIEFPLYLTFDYCEEDFFMTTCVRAADELGVKLYNCLTAISNEYGEDISGTGIYFIVSGQILDMLGIEIHVENSKVVEVHKDISIFWLVTNGMYDYTQVNQVGSLSCEYY